MAEKSLKDAADGLQSDADGDDSREGDGQAGVWGSSQSETDGSSFGSLLRQVAQDDHLPGRGPRCGDIVGEKYRIEERLGRGGMGEVFRATHVVSKKPVAIKWMLRAASDGHARARFVREAHAAGRIDHPNVVNVYDIGQQDDGAYLVMELLRGDSLRARLAKGPLGIGEAIELLLPAMRGVSAVHEAGVIHRDLKPDNVFLCEGPDGSPREAKVLDFGISALTATEATDATLTQDGAVLGTPAYMSPEQLQNSRDIDARSDVYSFGVILYEALTGVTPFAAASYQGLVLAIVHQKPRDPSDLRPDLPSALGRVVLRALAKQREDRYSSVEQLMLALRPYAASHAGQSAPRSPTAQASVRGRMWAAAGGLILALALAWWLFDRTAKVAPVHGHGPERPAPSAVSPAARVPSALPGAEHALGAPAPTPTTAGAAANTPSAGAANPKKRKPPTPALPRANLRHETPTNTATNARSGNISLDEL